MALLDTLRERTARRGRSAQVDCGDLGEMTVEALTPAECARLAGNSRALLYAACRELQAAGEALRAEGKLFRPEEVLEYLGNEEAEAAAAVILSLSTVAPGAAKPPAAAQEAPVTDSKETAADPVPEQTEPSSPANAEKESLSRLREAVPSLSEGEAAVYTAPSVPAASMNPQSSVVPLSLHSAVKTTVPRPRLTDPSGEKHGFSPPPATSPEAEDAPLRQSPADITPELAETIAAAMVKQLRLAAMVR